MGWSGFFLYFITHSLPIINLFFTFCTDWWWCWIIESVWYPKIYFSFWRLENHFHYSSFDETMTSILHFYNMERKYKICDRVCQEFGFGLLLEEIFYYCHKISYSDLVRAINFKFGLCEIFYRSDHIVVRTHSKLYLLLLERHENCASFVRKY